MHFANAGPGSGYFAGAAGSISLQAVKTGLGW